MIGLTEKQQEVYEFIHDYIKARGYFPRVQDIAEHFDVSRQASGQYLESLVRKGVVEKEKRGVYKLVKREHDKKEIILRDMNSKLDDIKKLLKYNNDSR